MGENCVWKEDRRQALYRLAQKFCDDGFRAAHALPGVMTTSPSVDYEITEKSSSIPRVDVQLQDVPVIRLIDAGGVAGGAKAVDEANGLFLKTPDNSLGIYPSDVLACKAAKHEVTAAAYLHSMSLLHINAPLMLIVDVPHGPTSELGCRAVQRVLVQSKVNVSGDTLRVGSSNGGRTMHVDET